MMERKEEEISHSSQVKETEQRLGLGRHKCLVRRVESLANAASSRPLARGAWFGGRSSNLVVFVEQEGKTRVCVHGIDVPKF